MSSAHHKDAGAARGAEMGAVAMTGPRDMTSKLFSCSLIALTALTALLAVAATASAQSAGCNLVEDTRNPKVKILRCGNGLTMRAAPDTRYELTDQTGDQPPGGARLDSGALIIEFTPTDTGRKFQILTPHAIAAVRGTTWAVEVVPDRSSTLVLTGTVEVKRPRGGQVVVLHAGDGVDVSASGGRLAVKQWKKRRINALLARFGQ